MVCQYLKKEVDFSGKIGLLIIALHDGAMD